MKTVSAALKAHLEGTLLTICTLWNVTRTDGLVFGFTDHDQDVTYDGVTYLAATGHNPSSIKTTAQLSVDNLEVQSMLSSSTITEADIAAGLWDFAEVLIQVVNYRDLTMGSMIQRKGWLGNIRTGRFNFIAELRGMMQPLQQQIGRIYSPGCDAAFGDVRCGVLGDYATWNPNDRGTDIVLSGGNLVATTPAGTYHAVRADQSLLSAALYWEVTLTTSKYISIGVANISANMSAASSVVSVSDGRNALVCNFNGYIISNGSIVGTLGTALLEGDVIGIAANISAGTIAFRVNGGAFTTMAGANVPTGALYPALGGQSNPPGSVVTTNFGETAFVHSPPAGYVGVNDGIIKYTVTGNVTTATSARQFTDAARTENAAYFDGGLITWTSGLNNTYRMEVKTFANGVVTLQQAMPNVIGVGDAYSMSAGCDKLRATCISKFNNIVNFRGFPDIPGNDAMLSGEI